MKVSFGKRRQQGGEEVGEGKRLTSCSLTASLLTPLRWVLFFLLRAMAIRRRGVWVGGRVQEQEQAEFRGGETLSKSKSGQV